MSSPRRCESNIKFGKVAAEWQHPDHAHDFYGRGEQDFRDHRDGHAGPNVVMFLAESIAA